MIHISSMNHLFAAAPGWLPMYMYSLPSAIFTNNTPGGGGGVRQVRYVWLSEFETSATITLVCAGSRTDPVYAFDMHPHITNPSDAKFGGLFTVDVE